MPLPIRPAPIAGIERYGAVTMRGYLQVPAAVQGRKTEIWEKVHEEHFILHYFGESEKTWPIFTSNVQRMLPGKAKDECIPIHPQTPGQSRARFGLFKQ